METTLRAAAGQEPLSINLDEVQPDPKAQRNFTDPDSKIMQASNTGWDQCGNAQVLVDESQLIIAADVTPQANDVRQVAPLLDKMEANLEAAEITQRPEMLWPTRATTATTTRSAWCPMRWSRTSPHSD